MTDAIPTLIAAVPQTAGTAASAPADPGTGGFPQFLAALLGTGGGPTQPVLPGTVPEPNATTEQPAEQTPPPALPKPPAITGTASDPGEPPLSTTPDAEPDRGTAAKDKSASHSEAEPGSSPPTPVILPTPPAQPPAPEQAPQRHQTTRPSRDNPPPLVTAAAEKSLAPVAEAAASHSSPQQTAIETAEPSAPAPPAPESVTVGAAPAPRPAEPPPAAPAPASRAATPPPAAAQVAAPLFALSQREDGAQRISLRLEPAELGQVEIRIDRADKGPARVEIAVERAETLTLLLRDQTQLQHALDRAGVPAEGRTLEIHLATPDPQPATPSFSSASTNGGPAGGGSGSPQRHPQPAHQDQPQQESSPPDRAALHWLRAGLDITA